MVALTTVVKVSYDGYFHIPCIVEYIRIGHISKLKILGFLAYARIGNIKSLFGICIKDKITRISIDKDDFGYIDNAYQYEADKDGEKLCSCITADSKRNYAVCTKFGADGRPVIEGDSLGRVIVHGNIEFKLRDDE